MQRADSMVGQSRQLSNRVAFVNLAKLDVAHRSVGTVPQSESGGNTDDHQRPPIRTWMQHLATSVGTIASVTLLGMLNRFRQSAPAVASLLCVALLAIWITGAHAHRHVGAQDGGQTLHAWAEMDSDREHGHGHELDIDQAIAADFPRSEHDDGDHFDIHPLSQPHPDGYENIELLAVQAPAVKSLLDLPLLLCVAILVLTRTQIPVVAALTDPPDPKRVDWFLRPPLRGPPLFSVV